VSEIISNADGISNRTEVIRQVRGNNKVTIRDGKHVSRDLIPEGRDLILDGRLTSNGSPRPNGSPKECGTVEREKKKKVTRVQDRDITPFSRNSIPLEFMLGDE